MSRDVNLITKSMYIVNAEAINHDEEFVPYVLNCMVQSGSAFEIKVGYELRKFYKELKEYYKKYLCVHGKPVQRWLYKHTPEYFTGFMCYSNDVYNDMKHIYETKIKQKGIANIMETHYMLDIKNKNADERVKDTIEKTNELNKMMNSDENVSCNAECYFQSGKVKAIKNTIEQYMKNTGKSDLKDIDLTELSSCINATFNRKKLFYKWFDEYIDGSDCSEEERAIACEFLDWVFIHKIDGDKTGDLYFKE